MSQPWKKHPRISREPKFIDAVAMADAVRTHQVTPTELVDDAIVRIEALNPNLNAVIHPLFAKAREAASSGNLPAGPFRGVPLILKDLLCPTAGDPYHLGMAFLRDRQWTAKRSSYLAERFLRAGFITVGRSNTPELGASATTEPSAYGATRNPWHPDYSTGGSSGGSAAAVASGMVPVAHGNDMGGSIRIPASACGLVGLKPSRGRISLGPDFGDYWGGLASEGILTRTVRDTAALLDVMAGPESGDPYLIPQPLRPYSQEPGQDPGRLRIGLLTESLAVKVNNECRFAVETAGHLLEAQGHIVEPIPAEILHNPEPASLANFGVYIARELERWSRITGDVVGPDDVEPWTWTLAEAGKSVSATEYLAAAEHRQRYSRQLGKWWITGDDILLTPTMAQPPPLLGRNPADLLADYGSFTIPWNMTGQPALSLPLHQTNDGLPVGVQLVAAFGREDVLLRVASQFAQIIEHG